MNLSDPKALGLIAVSEHRDSGLLVRPQGALPSSGNSGLAKSSSGGKPKKSALKAGTDSGGGGGGAGDDAADEDSPPPAIGRAVM